MSGTDAKSTAGSIVMTSKELPMRPKRKLILTSALTAALCVAGIAVLTAQEAAKSGPIAAPKELTADVGRVEYGDVAKHEFVIENEGDETLELYDEKTSCACTVTDYDKEIAPGESGTVGVEVETDTQVGGGFSVFVTLMTNDPSNPKLTLNLKGAVNYRVSAKPGYIRYQLYQGYDGTTALRQLIFSTDGNPVKVVGVEPPKGMSASFREATEEESTPDFPGQQWIVETTVEDDLPIGPIAEWLTVNLDHKHQNLMRLPVSGFVRPMFAVTPAALELGERSLGEKQVFSLHVKNFATEEIELAGVESSVPGIEAKIMDPEEYGEKGRVYYVEVTLAPKIAKGPIKGALTIHTKSDKKPEIKVPITGTIL